MVVSPTVTVASLPFRDAGAPGPGPAYRGLIAADLGGWWPPRSTKPRPPGALSSADITIASRPGRGNVCSITQRGQRSGATPARTRPRTSASRTPHARPHAQDPARARAASPRSCLRPCARGGLATRNRPSEPAGDGRGAATTASVVVRGADRGVVDLTRAGSNRSTDQRASERSARLSLDPLLTRRSC